MDLEKTICLFGIALFKKLLKQITHMYSTYDQVLLTWSQFADFASCHPDVIFRKKEDCLPTLLDSSFVKFVLLIL